MFLSRFLTPLTGIVTEDYLDCEEVHIVVCDIVFNLTTYLNSSQICPILGQLIPLLLELLENSFKTVKAKVCKCINSLVKAISGELQEYSKEIIESLLPCLKHPDVQVRVNALETLRTLAFIYSQSTFRAMFDIILAKGKDGLFKLLEFSQDNIMSVVLRDEDSNVRKTFFGIVCEWTSKMPYKEEIEGNLIPFLIFGLFDPVKEVRECCRGLFDQLGIEWEQSHGCFNSSDTLGDPNSQGIYPWHPFENRPRFGLRMYLLKHFEDACPILLHELSNELSPYRETASKLLFSLILMTEYINDENASKVLHSLSSCISLSEGDKTQQLIFQSLELIGRFLPAKHLLKYLSPARSSSILCMFFCLPVHSLSPSSQIISLTCLTKGTLARLEHDLEANLPSLLKFIQKFERSKFTLQFIYTLIDSSYCFSPVSKTEIFSVLIEHEHESVHKYIKKIQENWYQLDLSHFNDTVQDNMRKVTEIKVKDWKSSTLNVIYM